MKHYPGVRKPPKRVSFKYPNGHRLRGVVLEEVYERASYEGGEYLFVVQKIHLDGHSAKQYDVRIGYYRKERREKTWRWGSQTTFQADKTTVARVLRRAMAKNIINI